MYKPNKANVGQAVTLKQNRNLLKKFRPHLTHGGCLVLGRKPNPSELNFRLAYELRCICEAVFIVPAVCFNIKEKGR